LRSAARATARAGLSPVRNSGWQFRSLPKNLRMPRINPVHYRKLVRILEVEGFMLARERGDHMVFTKSGIERPAVVPRYDQLPVFIIKNVLRTAKISRDRYLELLDQL